MCGGLCGPAGGFLLHYQLPRHLAEDKNLPVALTKCLCPPKIYPWLHPRMHLCISQDPPDIGLRGFAGRLPPLKITLNKNLCKWHLPPSCTGVQPGPGCLLGGGTCYRFLQKPPRFLMESEPVWILGPNTFPAMPGLWTVTKNASPIFVCAKFRKTVYPGSRECVSTSRCC